MKIIISGAGGEVGNDLIKRLLEKNLKVVANIRDLKKIKYYDPNLKWIKHDFIKNLNKKMKIQIIVNCIAAHDFSKKNKFIDLIRSNFLSMKNLINFAKKNKVRLFINLSTVSVYGKFNEKNLNENITPIYQDNLGVTKLMGENLLSKSKISYLNLRLPGILTNSNNFERPWLKKIINNMKRNKKIILSNPNTSFNNVIDTIELVKFIHFIISKKKYKTNLKGTFNLSATKPLKLIKIIKLIKANYRSDSKIKVNNIKKSSFIFKNKKIFRELKYLPSSTKSVVLRNLI